MIPRPASVPAPAPESSYVPILNNVIGSTKLSNVSLQVTNLTISSNCCNDLNALDLNRFECLRSIEIGNDCFESVQTFKINGLKQLKTLIIGNNSFTQNKQSNWKSDTWHFAINRSNNKSKSFHILNCVSLETIDIGHYSFNDFGGDFELKNLPNLHTFLTNSYNFYYGSFMIRGTIYYDTSED